MTDENEGTTPEEVEAQPEAVGTPVPGQDVTTLQSRLAGQDAKNTALLKEQKALAAERDALKAQLAEAQKGVVDKDEALRAQVEAKEQELAEARQEAAMARIAANYPETFAELGTAAAVLTPEKLASMEARLRGAGFESANPTPVGTGAARVPSGPKALEDMTAAELRSHLATFPPSAWGSIPSD